MFVQSYLFLCHFMLNILFLAESSCRLASGQLITWVYLLSRWLSSLKLAPGQLVSCFAITMTQQSKTGPWIFFAITMTQQSKTGFGPAGIFFLLSRWLSSLTQQNWPRASWYNFCYHDDSAVWRSKPDPAPAGNYSLFCCHNDSAVFPAKLTLF